MTMTRAFVELDEHVGLPAVNNGGMIRAGGDAVQVPSTIGLTKTGVAFGPLLLEVPPETTLTVESMRFLPTGDDGGSLLLTAGAATAAGTIATPKTDIETETSRRSMLVALAAIVLAGTVTGDATADDEELVTLNLTKFELAEPDGPVTVTVLDLVDEVLPEPSKILIDQNNARVGAVTELNEGVTLRQVGGEVDVYVRDTLGRIAQLLAWARSTFPSDESLTYRRSFPNGTQASDYGEDEFVTVSSHPAVVDPVIEADEGRTVFEIGDTKINHADDGTNAAGAWGVLDDELVYYGGTDPPDESEWQVTTRLSAWQAFRQ